MCVAAQIFNFFLLLFNLFFIINKVQKNQSEGYGAPLGNASHSNTLARNHLTDTSPYNKKLSHKLCCFFVFQG